jgi:polar amino acid transport system permease protein
MTVLFSTFFSLLPRYISAMGVTLGISLVAALLGGIGGFALNALRIGFPVVMSYPYRVYVWLIRGVPYFSQLVIVYFGLPVLGITLSAVQATVLSLALYASAYFAEIFRAGWASVPRGQLEACSAFGVRRWAAFRHVELPQAIAFAWPLLVNQLILIIKESAVASIITVPELTMTASDIVSSTFTYIVPYAMLIGGYWLLTHGVVFIAQRLAGRVSMPGAWQ